MFSLYLVLSSFYLVSFGNIFALDAFAFVFYGNGKVKNTQLNKIPNLYDSRFAC